MNTQAAAFARQNDIGADGRPSVARSAAAKEGKSASLRYPAEIRSHLSPRAARHDAATDRPWKCRFIDWIGRFIE
ncbi:MAG: hypothetical protein ACRC67_09435 [Inquilinus sp.]|uniref:hypothetical protein n=1 Tax=Inquilinus sp. TaxID=1932117 RepID=UPI003F30F1CE